MGEPLFYHVDVNSAYLSWSALKRLEDDPESVDIRTIPSVVGGDEASRHGIVLAKSMPAKKYGIVTAEPLSSARRKCPSLLSVPPDFHYYVEKSRAFIGLLEKYAPSVEQYSIDEAFCDMTGTEGLYGSLIDFAATIKDEIHAELGFTVNVGVAHNRFLAKMASDFTKPDRVHTLFEEEIPGKMWPLPIGDLFFVGKKSAEKLMGLGINTIGDAAHSDITMLEKRLGKAGVSIWNHANGIDDGITDRKEPKRKSYSNETTTGEDVTSEDAARIILLSLCETVAARIRADKAKVGVVSVYFRDSNFRNRSIQKTLKSPTDATVIIFEEAVALFKKLWKKEPMRLIGVSGVKSEENEYEQLSLFEAGADLRSEKLRKLDKAVDFIRSKYGRETIKRASLAGKETLGKLSLEKKGIKGKEKGS
ncbi:MAG: DNA polymerase IV [Lachnospiraceae bacterium]|nr:DNA polymerase IV [Lachnospiraceae bacterium]